MTMPNNLRKGYECKNVLERTAEQEDPRIKKEAAKRRLPYTIAIIAVSLILFAIFLPDSGPKMKWFGLWWL